MDDRSRTDPRTTELHEAMVAWARERGWNGSSRTKVPIAVVQEAFIRLPRWAGAHESERADLAGLLTALADTGRATPLRDTDREKVLLPIRLWLEPVAEQRIATIGAMPRWHPRLNMLAGYWPRAKPELQECFIALNAWTWSSPDPTLLHQRERALDIFGRFGDEKSFPTPEKTFDFLRAKPFFKDRELLWKLTHVEPDAPPLLGERILEEVEPNHFRRVGSGGVLLVLENSATYSSILAALPAKHDLGYLAWGLGSMFIASVRSMSERHRITDIRYFGDLDLTGLDIPRLAGIPAEARGLPPVRPAEGLYSMLFDHGLDKPSADRAAPRDRASQLASWLPQQHQARAVDLLVTRRRLAQEWVHRRMLVQQSGWHADLWQTNNSC